MRRRHFLGGLAAGIGAPVSKGAIDCGCAPMLAQTPLGAGAFERVGTKVRVTDMKVFGVSLTPDSDRPYVFVKLETNQGVVGWGEGTLEGNCVVCPWHHWTYDLGTGETTRPAGQRVAAYAVKVEGEDVLISLS